MFPGWEAPRARARELSMLEEGVAGPVGASGPQGGRGRVARSARTAESRSSATGALDDGSPVAPGLPS